MALKTCAEPGCPELTASTRCPTHTRDRDKRRGTKQQRGYSKAYDKGRAKEARKVATGLVNCWSCDTRISPLEPFQYGHCENNRSVIHGAEHPLCNQQHKGHPCPHTSHG